MDTNEHIAELVRLNDDVIQYGKTVRETMDAITQAKKRIAEIRNEIDVESKKESIVISDHSVIRYLQRHTDTDIESIRKHIYDTVYEPLKKEGFKDGIYFIEGLEVRFRNKRVTTII